MLFGYNTNGFAHHRLEDAIPILADLGYGAVAITLDHFALNPFDRGLHHQMGEVRGWLERCRMRCSIETGTRFLLDSRRKHQPTLLSAAAWEREYRLEFLKRAIWIAEALGADCVSFWSGTPTDDVPPSELKSRLVDGCRSLCDAAAARNIDLAFEPEPGMFIDNTLGYCELAEAVNHPRLRLTLDIGHLHCQGEPIVDAIRAHADRLVNVHIEDMRHGVHEHLAFGDGEIAFAPVLRALGDVVYENGVYVELARHSHDAIETARRSIRFLRSA